MTGSYLQPARLTDCGQYSSSPGHSNYCHTELAASFIDFLHYCSPSSGFCGAAKDNRGRHTDNSSGRHPIQTVHPPISIITHFWLNALSVAAVPVYPAWYRHQIMLACIPSGLVCIFSLIMWIYEYHKSVVIVQYCLLIWCKFWPFAATAFLLQRVYVILVWVLYVCSINCFSVCRCWDSQILFLIYVIFTAWCYASAVYAVNACLCVRPSVCLSQIGIVSKWLDR